MKSKFVKLVKASALCIALTGAAHSLSAQTFGNGTSELLRGFDCDQTGIADYNSGYYPIYGGINFPGTDRAMHFWTFNFDRTGYSFQMAAGADSKGGLYFRKYRGGTSLGWLKVATDEANTFSGLQTFQAESQFNGNATFAAPASFAASASFSGDAEFNGLLNVGAESQLTVDGPAIFNSEPVFNNGFSLAGSSLIHLENENNSVSISADKTQISGGLFEYFAPHFDRDITVFSIDRDNIQANRPVTINQLSNSSADPCISTRLKIYAGYGTGIESYAGDKKQWYSSYLYGYSGKFYGGRFVIADNKDASPDFYVNENGYVTIGTDQVYENNYKLSVNGKVACKELKVDASEWADYVFDNCYKLRSLKEVETFIKANKHLPDVPSGKTVETEGIKVGEMQTVMMQKIEELTLYTIGQEKKLELQQEQINAQLELIKTQQAAIDKLLNQ